MARFGFLSTFPPTRCGLATFTESLATAVTAGGIDEAVVVRVDDLVPAGPAVSKGTLRIAGDLRPGVPDDRLAAVEVLDDCDAVIVQHEYGIYGGPDGDEILDILARLRRPAIVVLHTVLATPTAHQREVISRIADLAGLVVVMTRAAEHLLLQHYSVSASIIQVIPHGVDPVLTEVPAHRFPRPVILTWGLIGPGKGIAWAIRAMAAVRDLSPAPLYRVLGQTHPKVVLDQGERYRDSLTSLADRLGVADQVQLDDRYRETPDLAAQVAAADIVLLPYDSREQVTSGVLAEAHAAGKFVIATRFPHAVELLSRGGGILVDHENPDQIAQAIRSRLRGSHLRGLSTPATAIAATSWAEVAEHYRSAATVLPAAAFTAAARA